MTKAIIFFIQPYDKSSHVNHTYDDYIQEIYDECRSWGFNAMYFIDATPNLEVPQPTTSNEFERLRYESLSDLLEAHPTLELYPFVAPVEVDEWNQTPTSVKDMIFPQDDFAFVFGRDTGGLKQEEIDLIKTRDYTTINIPTPFQGALYADKAINTALWEYNR